MVDSTPQHIYPTDIPHPAGPSAHRTSLQILWWNLSGTHAWTAQLGNPIQQHSTNHNEKFI